ncbi:MAG TPA: phage terminase large subunit family protein, partial [Phycisphaerae bacterium]|nr:phage terminase large subunit family protein [Phycisphaerae bacterium]
MISPQYAPAEHRIAAALARALAPRKALPVSQWSDLHRRLSSKGSAEPGKWRTERNPPLREPMDCLSSRSPVRVCVLMFPIQFGKTEIAVNALGYTMDHNPGPIMVCLPGEVSLHKWVAQKLGPMLEETPAVRATLASTDSRNGSNRREFKDFAGGQLYLEHAGSPQRLKSTSVRTLIVDELDEFAANLSSGD